MKFMEKGHPTLRIGQKRSINYRKAHGQCGGYRLMTFRGNRFRLRKQKHPILAKNKRNDHIFIGFSLTIISILNSKTEIFQRIKGNCYHHHLKAQLFLNGLFSLFAYFTFRHPSIRQVQFVNSQLKVHFLTFRRRATLKDQ